MSVKQVSRATIMGKPFIKWNVCVAAVTTERMVRIFGNANVQNAKADNHVLVAKGVVAPLVVDIY